MSARGRDADAFAELPGSEDPGDEDPFLAEAEEEQDHEEAVSEEAEFVGMLRELFEVIRIGTTESAPRRKALEQARDALIRLGSREGERHAWCAYEEYTCQLLFEIYKRSYDPSLTTCTFTVKSEWLPFIEQQNKALSHCSACIRNRHKHIHKFIENIASKSSNESPNMKQ